MVNNVGRSVAFGEESADLIELRQTLRSSMDVHYLNAIASRAISAKGRSFKGQSIENYTAKALMLDGCDFSNSLLNAVTFARSSMSGCSFGGAALQVLPPCIFPPFSSRTLQAHDNSAALCDRGLRSQQRERDHQRASFERGIHQGSV